MITRSNLPVFLLILLLAVAFIGCAASPWAAKSQPGPGSGPEFAPGGDPMPTAPTVPTMPSLNHPVPGPPVPGPPVPGPMAAGGSAPPPQALQQVMAEVERLGAVDPRAQAQLIEELKQVEPSLWPMAVKSVWSRVAYAQRFNQGRQKEHLADRRAADIGQCRGETNLRENHPADYPTTATTYPGTATTYPTTAATAESPLPHIGPPAQLDKNQKDPKNQLDGNNRASMPPLPGQGAALDAPDSRATTAATAAKARPSGVIHTSYHAESSANNEHVKHDGPAKRATSSDDDWRTRLAEAIAALESRLAAENSADDDSAADHARLRILQLMAGRRGAALAEMPIDDAAMRDFWAKELFGLDILLDTRRISRGPRRAAEAKRHLSDATRSLGESATLEVRNMAFCREVQSYGSIARFEKREFSPGQRVLLYAEVDNFRSEDTAQGYHTSLRSSFQIFDSSGRRIDQRESTTTEEHCLSPRRDYFIGCDFRLPIGISPGRHTLKLTVEDLKSHKVGESSLDFTVVKR